MARLKQIGIDVEVNGIIEKNRRTFSESENEILRRLLKVDGATGTRAAAARQGKQPPSEPQTRQTGLWTVQILAERLPASNLKGAYKTLLLELRRREPSFFETFARERSRSRRFVARSPDNLYLASPELAKDHARPLADGWYFDTNLSTQQVAQRARIAARLCGLAYGRDVRILNGLEEI